jgi:predicted transcriptional regulator
MQGPSKPTDRVLVVISLLPTATEGSKLSNESGIYRPRLSPDGRFTIIDNHWIRNSGLGPYANYLLIYLVSHEVGYEIKMPQILRETGMGPRAVRSAMNELQEKGWLITKRAVNKLGQLGPYRYEITEPASVRLSTVEDSTVDNATMDDRTRIKNTNNTENKSIEDKVIVSALDQQFDEFYKLYPRKMQVGAARRAFIKALTKAKFEDVLEGVIRFANDPNLPPDQFVPYPATWLRAESWLDGPLPFDDRRQKEKQELEDKRKMEEWLNEQDGN